MMKLEPFPRKRADTHLKNSLMRYLLFSDSRRANLFALPENRLTEAFSWTIPPILWKPNGRTLRLAVMNCMRSPESSTARQVGRADYPSVTQALAPAL